MGLEPQGLEICPFPLLWLPASVRHAETKAIQLTYNTKTNNMSPSALHKCVLYKRPRPMQVFNTPVQVFNNNDNNNNEQICIVP